jgi:translation initiation factor 3 subunit B
LDESFDNVIVVDGIPIIDKSKLEKLLAKIGKKFSRKEAPISVDDIFVPWNDQTKKSQG